MHHPAVDEIKYEDTTSLPLDKPATAEELGRKLLKAENIQGVLKVIQVCKQSR